MHRANGMVRMLDSPNPPEADVTFDLSKGNVPLWIQKSFETLFSSGNRVMRVIGRTPFEPGATVEMLLDEAPLRAEMWDFGGRILRLSIIISLTTAALVYLSLQWLLVRPMRRLTDSMTAFRRDPEDASLRIAPSGRNDEIGRAQNELATLQETVRQALGQHARLAALGTAVTKINHDLRSILATARLVGDSFADSASPEVRRVAPRLIEAIDRAVALCTNTLDFSRQGAPPFAPSMFPLRPLIEEIPPALGSPRTRCRSRWEVPDKLRVRADRDQLYASCSTSPATRSRRARASCASRRAARAARSRSRSPITAPACRRVRAKTCSGHFSGRRARAAAGSAWRSRAN